VDRFSRDPDAADLRRRVLSSSPGRPFVTETGAGTQGLGEPEPRARTRGDSSANQAGRCLIASFTCTFAFARIPPRVLAKMPGPWLARRPEAVGTAPISGLSLARPRRGVAGVARWSLGIHVRAEPLCGSGSRRLVTAPRGSEGVAVLRDRARTESRGFSRPASTGLARERSLRSGAKAAVGAARMRTISSRRHAGRRWPLVAQCSRLEHETAAARRCAPASAPEFERGAMALSGRRW
jgi:hypothetical protein